MRLARWFGKLRPSVAVLAIEGIITRNYAPLRNYALMRNLA
jgi:hypothetical protein